MLRIRELEPADADFLGAMLYEAVYWDPAKERLPAEFVLAHPQLTIFHAGWGRPGDTGLVAEVDDEPRGRRLVPALHRSRARRGVRRRGDARARDLGCGRISAAGGSAAR